MDLGLKGKVAIELAGQKELARVRRNPGARRGDVVSQIWIKRRKTSLKRLRTAVQAMAVVVDVSKSDSVEQMINAVYDEFGK